MSERVGLSGPTVSGVRRIGSEALEALASFCTAQKRAMIGVDRMEQFDLYTLYTRRRQRETALDASLVIMGFAVRLGSEFSKVSTLAEASCLIK